MNKRALKLVSELKTVRWLYARGDHAEALALTNRLFEQTRGVRGLAQVVNAYYDMGNIEHYERGLQRLLQSAPDDPELLLALAGAYLHNVRPALARMTFQRFLDCWPRHARFADVEREARSLDRDLGEYFQSLRLHGADRLELAAMHEETLALLERGMVAPARILSDSLLERAPDFVPALNNASQMHWMEGRADRAIEAARRVLALDADNVHALGNLARFLHEGGEIKQSESMLERLRALEGGGEVHRLKLAETLRHLGLANL
ncbi:MAG: tetratricopeptide repeat protein [Armatimonadetes bacterium]|nr:tetratricopeptide repeat protein [Armatimonadota bacterium]